MWSGRVNHWLREYAQALPPGTALDLACGEGGDALWLASQGWTVTALDFASAAVERGRAAAAERGLADRLTWVCADLAQWKPPEGYDLVTMHFLHTPDRDLRDAALLTAFEAAGGVLLIVAHDPANAIDGTAGGPPDPAVLYSAADVLAVLGVDHDDPRVVRAEQVLRDSPQGRWVDSVLVLNRAG